MRPVRPGLVELSLSASAASLFSAAAATAAAVAATTTAQRKRRVASDFELFDVDTRR